MKRGDHQIKYCHDIACIKWIGKSVMLLGSNINNTGSNVMRRQKGSATKAPVSCPEAIKIYNTDIGGVDFMDQFKSTYRLNKRSKFRFYLRLFFDLHDVTCMRAFIIYKKLENTKLILKNFKVLITEMIIVSFLSRRNS